MHLLDRRLKTKVAVLFVTNVASLVVLLSQTWFAVSLQLLLYAS